MIYSQLKNLEMPTLFALVQRTLNRVYDLTPDQFVQGSLLPVPILFLIGDFEIRARFLEDPKPEPIPSNPEDLQYIDALKAKCERLEKALAEEDRSHCGHRTSERPRQIGSDSNQRNPPLFYPDPIFR
jgi:hypothetical protein